GVNGRTNAAGSLRAIQFSEQYPEVFAAVGWHPSEADDAPADLRPELRQWARHPKVIAIGETGLDYHHLPSEKPGGASADDDRYKQRQRALFRQHLEVAAELGLNCIVHQRNALEDVLAEVEPWAGRVRAVFHCFVNDAAAMKRIIALNSLVSFTGIITFRNAQEVRDTLVATPMDKFMLETDCPFLAPVPYRGKRSEPAHIREIAQAAAQVKQCTMEELSVATCATARSFYTGMT
ncbi:MAG: TatD family hydrolase, partial [Candidatus Omnitrophica bacterium]|nr:TatD family hydrolase [Candidatus Omnitrophota bacterium]